MSDDQIYDDTYSQIQSVDFDVWGNDQIKRASALGKGEGVTIPDLYDGGDPKKEGLIDPRLGPSSHDIYCAQCGLDMECCVGHFGHIDLAEIVFHIGYLQYVCNILKCICPRCAKLLIYKNEDEIKELLKIRFGKDRMNYIRAASKNVTYCQHVNYGCGVQIPKIKVETKKSSSAINIVAEIEVDGKDENEGKKKTRHVLPPEAVYDILRNISDEDCRILGMDPTRSRPEDMVHKIFPVPPVPMRPSAKGDFSGGSSMEDDLTHKLADIVKANMRIIKNKENQGETASKYNSDHAYLLQYHCATYIENESMTLLKSEQKGKPFKSLASRLKAKGGRVRGNLMGKRGDFTARTVITSDPTISINQLGVPMKIAMNLTFPETVTPYNIEELSKLVKNGREKYPGANYVFPANPYVPGKKTKQIDLRFRSEGVELHYGDVVERHLRDGDIVLLNRQPTLHKQSMMGHKIKVINNPELLTYRLSVAVTTPYNADFDGDEMNIFVPQSLQTQVELEEIAAVERQLIDPGNSKTVMGIVQDGLLGAYNLTSPTVRINWRNAMNIMSYTSLEDFSYIKKDKDYTGSELFSLIVPPGINMHKGSLKIKNGKIIEGRLSKDALGAKKKNNLVQLIWDAYGVEETRKFVDNTQRLVNNFNLWNGFSVGMADTVVPPSVYEEIEKKFQSQELKIEHIITEMENNPNLMKQELYEFRLFSEMNIIRDDVSKLIMSNLSSTNSFQIMSSSGSKGDPTNSGQMCGCLGLQVFEGKIMPKKYNGRTLAYFHQHDDRGPSRGLVKQSFIRGLEYPQYVFHLMASRLGIIEQAIKSVIGDTPMIIQENGETKDVNIGNWIDDLMDKHRNDVVKEGDYDMESLELKDDIYIPTSDEKGNTSWGKVTSITRHDPTKEMYKITTYGGREAITADSKSLLVWNKEQQKFIPTTPMDMKIGDFVPVTSNLKKPPLIIDYVNTKKYFSSDDKYLESKGHIIQEKFPLTRENGVFVGLYLADGNSNIQNGCVKITKNDKSLQNFVSQWFGKNNIECNIQNNIENNVKETFAEIKGSSRMLAQFLTKFVGHESEQKHIPNEAYSAPDDFIIGLLDGYFSGNCNFEDNSVVVSSTSKKMIEGISELCNRFGIFGKLKKSEKSQEKTSVLNPDEMLPTYFFSISGKWTNIFKQKVKLTNDEKNKKLESMSSSDVDENLCEYNDVVFDKVETIEKVDTTKYKKLYDMTIPSTLNFGSRGGLIYRDTAETGYAQRKLVKSMEDIMIKYDNTVRSANNGIIQFVYGDSGADTTKQYEYTIRMIESNNQELENKHKFTLQELKNLKGFTEPDNEKLYKDIISMRNHLRETVRRAKMNYIVLTNTFMIPVNLNRIIDTIAGSDIKSSELLTPQYIIEQLENLLSNTMTTIICMSHKERNDNNSLKNKDERLHKVVFRTALYDSLSPKKVLLERQLNKKQFDAIISEISSSFNKNMIEPGEMAGVISAQSTGEPLTQMTLNSIDWSDKVLLRDNKTNTNYVIEIGKFIDNLLKENINDVKYLGNNKKDEMGDVQYLDTKNKDYFVPSVDENGVVSWKKIEAITKHLPINKDGTSTLVKITTKLGREVIATKAKSFLTRINDKIVPIRGDEIEVGTVLPVMKDFPNLESNKWDDYYDISDVKKLELDNTFGFIIGTYIAKGYCNETEIVIPSNDKQSREKIKEFTEKYSIDYHETLQEKQQYDIVLRSSFFSKLIEKICGTTHNKMIPDFAYTANSKFITGLLNGYFTNNETVSESQEFVGISSRSKSLIVGLSTLLSRLNIVSKISTFGNINVFHTLSITDDNIKKLSEEIKMSFNYKEDLNDADDKISKNNIYFDEIVSIEEVKPTNEFVYDFTVADTKNFIIHNGLSMRDSFHHSGISTLSSQLGGVPRIKELLSTSKKPKSPSMFIYFTEEFAQSKDMAHKVASHIKHTTLGEVRSRLNVYYDPNPTAKGSIMEKDNIKQVFHHNKGSRTGCQSDITGLPWLMRIELDREKMLEKEVVLLDVVSKFCSWWERRFSENKQMKKEEKKVLNKITQMAVLSNTDNDKYPVVHIRFNVKDADKDKDRFDLSTIDNFIDHIVDTFKLKGINGITDIPAIQEERALSFNSTTGDVEKKTQYVVYTSGVNLQEIRYLNGVDLTKTISNNVIEMYQTFGIEVARAVLLREIANSYEKAGGEVNYQHVSMIVDQMTATGQINSVDRHGMNKSDNDPLSRASFEKTVEQLLIAAVYAETDHMRGVSSRIMAGAVVEGGTGYCQLELDTDMIEKSEYLESSEQTKKFTELNKGTLADDIINKKEKRNIFVPV